MRFLFCLIASLLILTSHAATIPTYGNIEISDGRYMKDKFIIEYDLVFYDTTSDAKFEATIGIRFSDTVTTTIGQFSETRKIVENIVKIGTLERISTQKWKLVSGGTVFYMEREKSSEGDDTLILIVVVFGLFMLVRALSF